MAPWGRTPYACRQAHILSLPDPISLCLTSALITPLLCCVTQYSTGSYRNNRIQEWKALCLAPFRWRMGDTGHRAPIWKREATKSGRSGTGDSRNEVHSANPHFGGHVIFPLVGLRRKCTIPYPRNWHIFSFPHAHSDRLSVVPFPLTYHDTIKPGFFDSTTNNRTVARYAFLPSRLDPSFTIRILLVTDWRRSTLFILETK